MSRSAKTILITGASSGLGEGMARLFADKGYNLALTARRIDRLEALKAELEVKGIRVETRALDVNIHDDVFSVFDEIYQVFGKIDRVIVNAGQGDGAPVGKGEFNKNLATLNTNFIAAFAQSEAALKIFREQNEGHLVLISSMSALFLQPNSMAAYSVSKAAVSALGESLHLSFRKHKSIKISTILPGYISTDINSHVPRSKMPFIVDAKKGSELLVKAIEKEGKVSYVPFFPWAIAAKLRHIMPSKFTA